MSSSPKKILLLEDERALNKVASAKLRLAGYSVTVLESGVGALDCIKELKPDLVLLDLVMPQVDGFTVLKEVKSNPELKNTKVIVLSNLSQETDIDSVLKLGAAAFLVKSDTSLGQVLSEVQKHIGAA